MLLIGMIATKKDIQEIKKNIISDEINIIGINEESINNLKNIKFDEIIIMKNIKLKDETYKYIGEIISKAKYLIVNVDMEIDVLKKTKIKNPIKLITFGFNPKATITISSVKDDKIILCLQRNIEKTNKEIIEAKEIEIKNPESRKIYNNLVIFIIKGLHNLQKNATNIEEQ